MGDDGKFLMGDEFYSLDFLLWDAMWFSPAPPYHGDMIHGLLDNVANEENQ